MCVSDPDRVTEVEHFAFSEDSAMEFLAELLVTQLGAHRHGGGVRHLDLDVLAVNGDGHGLLLGGSWLHIDSVCCAGCADKVRTGCARFRPLDGPRQGYLSKIAIHYST